MNDSKETKTIDENNNRIGYLFQRWKDYNWGNGKKHTYTYDGNNNETEWLIQFWKGTDWVSYLIYKYNYSPITGIELDINKNITYKLSNNYPNPFNPSTTQKYSIPNQSNVTLKIFDVLGSEVASLVNKEQPQGNYEIKFDASELTSGIYFYRLQAGEIVKTKKIIMLK